jgi:PIN domain nuclease of toxin-antitoxin system
LIYIIDTHAVVFALTAPRKLGKAARAAMRRIEEGRVKAWIPAVVAAELIMLCELGRIDIGLSQLRAALDDVPALSFLPLELDQLDEFASLTSIRDPFDRLIVGAARARKARLITKDASLATTGLVETVWS